MYLFIYLFIYLFVFIDLSLYSNVFSRMSAKQTDILFRRFLYTAFDLYPLSSSLCLFRACMIVGRLFVYKG